MLITKEVVLNSNNKSDSFYKKLGYDVIDGKIHVKIEDVQKGSHVLVVAKCDICGTEKEIMYKAYNVILNSGGYNSFACSKKCGRFKSEQTCEKKYGFKNAAKSEIVKQNTINSNMVKYGVPYHTALEDVIAKKNATVEARYNVKHVVQSDFFKEKTRKTMNDKYNCSHALQHPEFKQKMKDTCIDRIGVDNPSKCEKIVKERISISDKKFLKYFKSVVDNNTYVLISNIGTLLTIHDNRCNSEFIISKVLFKDRVAVGNEISTILNPINSGSSTQELQVFKYIEELGVVPIKDKIVLEGKELDIYIDSHCAAIEYNGMYYHSNKFREKYYHLEKTIMCENKGVSLLHVWEFEWLQKKDIVKSIIKAHLNIYDYTVDANNCIIAENIEHNDIYMFMNQNSIKTCSIHDINICLYHNNELVSVMIFKNINNSEYLLLEMCNKLHTKIENSFNIMFTKFINNYIFDRIISYSEYRIFNGYKSLFNVLGFKYIELLDVNHFWSKGLKTYTNKDFVEMKLLRNSEKISKSEYEKLHSLDYRKIYDCGVIKWQYNKISK